MSAGNVPSNEYLIQTTVVGATPVASIEFDVSAYAGIYRHLKIIMVSKMSENVNYPLGEAWLQFNGVTTNSYAWHWLYGNGSSPISQGVTNQPKGVASRITSANAPSTQFGVSIIDILDPFSSSKNTTYRALSGAEQSNSGSGELRAVHLISGLFNSTAVITSIKIFPNTQNFVSGSRFSIYGVTA